MEDKPNNPPAFPHSAEFICQNSDGSYSSKPITDNGMSLRDYFAGQALLGLITDVNSVYNRAKDKVNGSMAEEAAFQAYSLADAMLKQREAL